MNPVLNTLFPGTDGGSGDKPKMVPKAPLAPRAAGSSEPFAEAQPAGALSDLFSGMVDDGNISSVTPQAAPTQLKEPPPTSHTINPYSYHVDLRKPRYMGVDELDLMGEATNDKMIMAARGFNQELYFNEGQDIERKANRMQDGYRMSHTGANDAQTSAIDIGLGGRALTLAHDTPVKDLESADGRMQTLNMLVQNRDPNDPNFDKTGDAACSGATLVAGVLYSEGRKGLKTLLAATRKPGEEEPPEMKALREKFEGEGEKLTIGDLQQLQSLVYKKLKDMEGSTPEELEKQITSKDPEEKAKAFVKPGTLDRFMNDMIDEGGGSKRSLKGMFTDHHLDVSAIDNDGDEKGNHVVLRIADKNNNPVAYYDPWMKKGTGGQIVNAMDGQIEGLGRSRDPTMDDYVNAGAEEHRGHYDGTRP